MLKLITREGETVPLRVDDYYIKELASGLDELLFTISIYDEAYPLIQEECRIIADDAQYYTVKAIDGGGNTASIKCIIDLDEWRQTLAMQYTTSGKVTVTGRTRYFANIDSSGYWDVTSMLDAYSIVIPIVPGKVYDVRWTTTDQQAVGTIFHAGQSSSNIPGEQLVTPTYSTPQDDQEISFLASEPYYVIEVDHNFAPACLDYLKMEMVRNDTPPEIIGDALPQDWTLVNSAGITDKAQIELTGATPYDILEACRDAFDGLTYRFDTVSKTITLLNMYNGQNLGAFVTRELNLKTNDYKGKSTDFATRLYAAGKDGMTFAAINAGKPYVDDNTYTDKIICAYWQDERYTNSASLLSAATEMVKTLAAPRRSYTCDVVDLAAAMPEKYGYLDFPLFSVCALIDDTRSGTKVNHVVMERWIYPNLPAKNKVVLSTVAPRLQSQVAHISRSMNNVNSEYQKQQRAVIDTLTGVMLGAHGGSVRLLDTDGDGEPDELYIADSTDPSTANRVWRFNNLGWGASANGYAGPYTMGATFEGGGTIYANNFAVKGSFAIKNADGSDAGYMGRGQGNDGTSDTYGVVIRGPGGTPESPTSQNYVIVTNSGVRMQSGSHSVWVSSGGAAYDGHEIATQEDISDINSQITAIWNYIHSMGT